MWVEFLNENDSRIKKFNLPSTDLRTKIEDGDGLWIRISRIEEPKRQLAGFAILKKDEKTRAFYWSTFSGEGKEHLNYPIGEPLLFPAGGKLAVGTRVDLHVVVE